MHPEDGEVIPPREEQGSRSRGQGSSGSRGQGRLHYSLREGWVRVPEAGFGGVSWLGLNRPPPGYPVQGSTRVQVMPNIKNMQEFPGVPEPKHVTRIQINSN